MKIIIDTKSKVKTYRFEKGEWLSFNQECNIKGYMAIELTNTKNLKLIPEEQYLFHEIAEDGALKVKVYDNY